MDFNFESIRLGILVGEVDQYASIVNLAANRSAICSRLSEEAEDGMRFLANIIFDRLIWEDEDFVDEDDWDDDFISEFIKMIVVLYDVSLKVIKESRRFLAYYGKETRILDSIINSMYPKISW